MEFVTIKTIKVIRKFKHVVDKDFGPGMELYRNCNLGCECRAHVSKAEPTPQAAESKSFCFNDRKLQGVSEVAGSAVAIKEGPDEWIYEVSCDLKQGVKEVH